MLTQLPASSIGVCVTSCLGSPCLRWRPCFAALPGLLKLHLSAQLLNQLIKCARWQAVVPLPGSPEKPEAPPVGTEWMEHELKLDAGPLSPSSINVADEIQPKVRVRQTRPLFMLCARFLLACVHSGPLCNINI